MNFARYWLLRCLQSYRECNITYGPALLPRRLIDVGSTNATSPTLYVPAIGESGFYITAKLPVGSKSSQNLYGKSGGLQAHYTLVILS